MKQTRVIKLLNTTKTDIEVMQKRIHTTKKKKKVVAHATMSVKKETVCFSLLHPSQA